MSDILVQTDGLCSPRNPGGVATYGWVAYRNDVFAGSSRGVLAVGRDATNNRGEYGGAIEALKFFLAAVPKGMSAPPRTVHLQTDSQLVVRQVKGIYAVRSPRIMPLYQELIALSKRYERVDFEWIPRSLNKAADLQSRMAYVEYWRRHDKTPPVAPFLTRAEIEEAEQALGPAAANDPLQTKLNTEGEEI